MSQAGIISVSGNGGSGSPVLSVTTQSGTATPITNQILIDAFDSTENNDNGVITRGGVNAGDPPGSGAANEVTVYLTNRIQGQVTSEDDSGDVLISFPLDTSDNLNYTFDFSVSAVSILPGPITVGGSWKLFTGAITDSDSTTATLLGVDSSVNFKSGTDVGGQTMVDTDVDALIVGSALTLLVTGMSSTDVEWYAVGYYTQIGN